MTSHGAILAREFKIPAIVSHNININDGQIVEIDGKNGTTKVVDMNH
jgi:phosphoenolpyruvate-protein kinase (PTS system EI component)